MRLLDRLLGRNSEQPERTVVYLRTYGYTPAKFMEREVCYDAWGVPYVHADTFHTSSWATNHLKSEGKTSDRYLQWKHKSGPDVIFPDKTAPDKGWFPK
jgi:hypothetical protein